MPWKTLRLIFACGIFALLAVAPSARAQEEYSRFELGAQYSTIRETKPDLSDANFSGFGGRFDWNLTRRLAFESQIDFFPQEGVPLPLVQGGRTTAAVF